MRKRKAYSPLQEPRSQIWRTRRFSLKGNTSYLREGLYGNQIWRSLKSWARAAQGTPSDIFSGIVVHTITHSRNIFGPVSELTWRIVYIRNAQGYGALRQRRGSSRRLVAACSSATDLLLRWWRRLQGPAAMDWWVKRIFWTPCRFSGEFRCGQSSETIREVALRWCAVLSVGWRAWIPREGSQYSIHGSRRVSECSELVYIWAPSLLYEYYGRGWRV